MKIKTEEAAVYGNNVAALKAYTNPPNFMHFTKTLAASHP